MKLISTLLQSFAFDRFPYGHFARRRGTWVRSSPCVRRKPRWHPGSESPSGPQEGRLVQDRVPPRGAGLVMYDVNRVFGLLLTRRPTPNADAHSASGSRAWCRRRWGPFLVRRSAIASPCGRSWVSSATPGTCRRSGRGPRPRARSGWYRTAIVLVVDCLDHPVVCRVCGGFVREGRRV